MYRKLKSDAGYNGGVVGVLMLSAVVLALVTYLVLRSETRTVVSGLEQIPIVRLEPGEPRITWQAFYGASGLPLWIRCQLDALCFPTLTVNPRPVRALGLGGATLLVLLLAGVVAALYRPQRQKLDVGLFLDSMRPEDYQDLPRFTQDMPDSPLAFAVGAPILVKEQITPVGETHVQYQYRNPLLIGVPDIDLNEHLLVDGGTGNGKTSSVILRILLAIALSRQAAIVPDVKYSEDDGGLNLAVKLFHNLGLPTYAITPFERDSVRIPIFDDIHSVDDGRKVSKVLFPLEDPTAMNAFYIEAQQNMLAGIFFVVAQSQAPNMKEVMRIIGYQREDMEQWARGLRYPEVRNMILGITNDQKIQFGGFRQGLLNALDPFHDPRVVRAFTAKEGQNVDMRRMLHEGGVAYVGIPKDELRGGRGQKVFMIIDNYLVSKALQLRRTDKLHSTKPLNLIYDEADKLGKIFELSVGVSMFRTSRIRYIFGYQNRELMIEQYGLNRWNAIEKLIATKISFPAGLKDEAAAQMSQTLGEKEYTIVGKGVSQRNIMGMPWDSDTRKSRNLSITTRPVLTQSQVIMFPKYIAILRLKSTLPPVMVPMVAVNLPEASFVGPDGKRFTRSNKALFEAWTAVMGDKTPQEHSADVTALIHSARSERRVEEPASLEDHYVDWISRVLDTGAEISVRNKKTEINWLTLTRELRNVELVTAFVQNGWLAIKENLLITPEDWTWVGVTDSGMLAIGPIGQAQLRRVQYLGPFMMWQRQIAQGSPELATREGEQIVMPEDAARNVTLRIVNRDHADLQPEQVAGATRDVLEQLERVTDGGVVKRVIPFKFNFETAIRQAVRRVKETEGAQGNQWTDVEGEIAGESGEERPPQRTRPPEARDEIGREREVPRPAAGDAPASPTPPAAGRGGRGLQNLKQNRKTPPPPVVPPPQQDQQAAGEPDEEEGGDFHWGT
ncbi:type IV secretory system conjugative DNA transfer family protein [Deinococcus petrolearius]|uniref:Type IV secretory system conjugative DNA transfer family protein n=1 Tax=Deinococcus petrolearius TaxID=1751295 RepID=A0ABW1DNN8_9DEIO